MRERTNCENVPLKSIVIRLHCKLFPYHPCILLFFLIFQLRSKSFANKMSGNRFELCSIPLAMCVFFADAESHA